MKTTWKTTWFHFLPEVGRPIIKKADDIYRKQQQIEALQQQLKMRRGEMSQLGMALESEIKENWTDSEIWESKSNFAESITK